MDSQTPIPTECCKNDRWFKIAAIIIGILIIIGLFGNIYLLLQRQKPPEQPGTLPTSAPTEIFTTPTIETGGCKNDVLKLSVSLPNEKWTCKSSIKEGDPEVGRYGLMEISSPIFEIKIGSYMDTGLACYGDEGPSIKCEVVAFFSNDLLNLKVLKHNGQEISFLGTFKDGKRAISIELKEKRALTTEEKGELTQFLKSISEVATTTSGQADPTANWKTYTSSKYKFQIKHPENIEVDCTDKASPNGCHIMIVGSFGAPGFEETFLNFYTKGEFEKEDRKKLLEMTVGEIKQICELPTPESCVYKRVSDFTGLVKFKVFENYNGWEVGADNIAVNYINERSSGYLDIFFYYNKNSLTNGGFSKRNFDLILSTFKFQ